MSGWRDATAGEPDIQEDGPVRLARLRRTIERATVRALPLFLGVLLVASAVNAQAPAQTPAGNPLCDWAFQQAAELVLGDPAGVPGPTASPASWQGRDLLDEAIRMCSSVEGFSASAALHPVTLLGADPVAVLVARCQDPAAGLDGYGPCVSLVHLLATPPPTPVPTASPSPAPTAPPAQPTPRPTAPPSSSGRARPPDTLTRVPSVRAEVAGADRIRYLPVRGSTPSRLVGSSSREAARFCGGHGQRAIACVMIRPSFAPSYVQDAATGSCTITGVDVGRLAVAYVPQWTAPRRVPASLAWWWRKLVARIGWHEAQHIKIATQHLARFPRLVTGKPCATYGRLARQWSRDLGAAQHAFDRRDYPRLAKASSAWLEQAERRFVQR